jgi:hypothetical protein
MTTLGNTGSIPVGASTMAPSSNGQDTEDYIVIVKGYTLQGHSIDGRYGRHARTAPIQNFY